MGPTFRVTAGLVLGTIAGFVLILDHPAPLTLAAVTAWVLGALLIAFREAAPPPAQVDSTSELLMAVSHELRTPVARLHFALEMLDTNDAAERATRIGKMADDLGELEEIISELLAFTSLREGNTTVRRKAMDPQEALERLVEDAEELRAGVSVSLSTPQPLKVVHCDARLFRRAVRNLVSNAVRYTKRRVVVSAAALDAGLRVCVDDDGPGVPEADRERIFEPMVRLDAARSRDTGGVGLGLALGRQIAVAHGGRLYVRESKLGGAQFVLEIPYR